MTRRLILAAVAALPATWACTDGVPTSGNERLIPEAQTFEIEIPYSDFVRDFQVFGGYSSAASLSHPPVAHEYRGELEARALVRFQSLPASVQVRPPGSQTTVADSAYTVVGGRIVLQMDTVGFPEGPIELAVGALEQLWHPETADWGHAVDTIGEQRSWDQPGGGTARDVGLESWDPLEGDSVFIVVDSATAVEWADRDVRAPGARIESRTPETFLRVRSAVFQADVRSELNPDTVLVVSASSEQTTVIYTPEPGTPDSEIHIGGAPARRTYLRIEPPRRIEVGSQLCAVVPCPIDLSPDRVVYAALVLETTATQPSAFRLIDPIGLEARPALAPERIPRSPLGATVQATSRTLQPQQFGEDAGTRVEVPMTRYVRDLLRGVEGDDEEPVPNTLALFASTEPSGIPFATFRGPGQEGEPFLRLIFTVSDGVQLP